ncbi:MAG: hypothetical protein AAGD01_05375 [Acidobacteriota bacterium]
MKPNPPEEPPSQETSTSLDPLPGKLSRWGLEWHDVQQIRERLKLTPTERLRVAQDLMNQLRQIRAQNDDPAAD